CTARALRQPRQAKPSRVARSRARARPGFRSRLVNRTTRMITVMLGAPLKEWIARGGIVLFIVAVLAIGSTLPIAWPLRAALLAVIVAVGVDQAFRRVPAFDPLRRVKGRLPRAGGGKRCAITFDDGPSRFTDAVLDILAAEGVPATFFV